MSTALQKQGKKWIQFFLVTVCIIEVVILIGFFQTLNGWFELETVIPNYQLASQGLAVLISLATFVYVLKHHKAKSYLSEVFNEAVKVVWPQHDDTVKSTFVIMVLVTIIGVILWLFDLTASGLLSLFN